MGIHVIEASGNLASTSEPPSIELVRACDAPWTPMDGGDLAPTLRLGTRFLDALDGVFPHGDWKTQPKPPAQVPMPDLEHAPPVPGTPGEAVPQPYRIRPVADILSARDPPSGRS